MLDRLLANKWYIAVILVLVVADPSMTSWLYLVLQDMYNTVTLGTPRMLIIQLILTGVLLWMAKRLVLFATSVIRSRFICNIKQDLKHDLFVNMLGLRTANLAAMGSSGEYISIFTNDVSILEQRYFSNVIGLISQIISVVIMGSTFFTMNPKLAFLVCIFGILVMIVPPLCAKRLNAANLEYSTLLSRFTQKLKEYLTAYSTIKNYAIERTVLGRFGGINTDVENSKFRYDCALALADGIGSLLTWFTQILVIGVGLIMVSNGEVQLGTVVAAQGFAGELATPLQGIVENANSIKSVKSIIEKIRNATSDQVLQTEAAEHVAPSSGEGLTVEFRDLTIRMGGRTIVDGFSFVFRPGGKYLMIGRNGSGKSSVFKALKKRFDDYDGTILVNGVDVRTLSSEGLSNLVSYLNENVAIFSGSLEDNITFWRDVPDTVYENALHRARIELDPKRPVGEDGFDISSGEQRRIEIARSLVFPAKLMVYDEVVSTLDVETAYDIEHEALGYADRTVVFISHNFSGKLVRDYDEILVMRDGRLVAHGDYDTLIKSSEYFRHICDIKFGTK